MKNILYVVTFCIISLLSCETNNISGVEAPENNIDSIQILKDEIENLKQEISLLKFPADQRLAKVKDQIKNENLDEAQNGISELKRIFPNSVEASCCDELTEQINSRRAKIKEEQDRIDALGFKAIKAKTTFTIGYNTIVLSNISVSNQFVFDSYDDRWFYRDADRGNKYITMAMSVKSTSKNPKLPQFAVYTVSGKIMSKVGTFETKYARWSDYGCYLGNYHDSRNDFAKVSTVSFKLGCELSNDILRQPYAIVVKNENVLTEEYDRFKNPPQYWMGGASYPATLSVDDFKSDYILIKMTNL